MKIKNIEHIDRLKQFLLYCDELNKHPFVEKHKNGFTFQYTEKVNFENDEENIVESNFDKIHLESLLARIRQFLFKNELFYYEDILKTVEKLLGVDREFSEFFSVLVEKLSMPFQSGNIQVFKVKDGAAKELVSGRTLKELIEVRLYSGAFHSERLINPKPGSVIDDFSGNDKYLFQYLNWELAGASVNTVGNIFRCRNQIILLARRADKINICPELEAVDERARSCGL
jgi:hypothetical protein